MGERLAGRTVIVTGQGVTRAYSCVRGRQVHYREAGDPARPTLLLLHQSPSHSAMYEPLMLALEESFHLLAPDTPGFGGSDPLRGEVSVAAYARALDDWLTTRGVRIDFVFGHHTGAAIAVQWLHDYPGSARAMALSGPALLDEEQKRTLPSLAAPFAEHADGEHLQQMWQRIRDKDPEAPLAITLREVLSALASGSAYEASYRAVAEQDFAGLLPAIECPVLVFAGDADPLYHAVAPTLALLPRGTGATLAGGERTYVCERQVNDIAALLADFFSQQGTNPLEEQA